MKIRICWESPSFSSCHELRFVWKVSWKCKQTFRKQHQSDVHVLQNYGKFRHFQDCRMKFQDNDGWKISIQVQVNFFVSLSMLISHCYSKIYDFIPFIHELTYFDPSYVHTSRKFIYLAEFLSNYFYQSSLQR